MTPPKRICYGEANFQALRESNGYFVDKTAYIRKLENFGSPVYLRPRRFGKSFLCSMLSTYYDVAKRDQFDFFFADTEIGKQPTPLRNGCLVLHFDFSVVEINGDIKQMESSFDLNCNITMDTFLGVYGTYFPTLQNLDFKTSATANLNRILGLVEKNKLPPLFITIDEYDNFANQMIVDGELVGKTGFLKNFFKVLKKGKGLRQIQRIFITGVLPILIDALASCFNIADFLTLDEHFEAMVGFTQPEVDTLLDQIYVDYRLPSHTREQVDAVIKDNYNGSLFTENEGETLYNPTILVYFLQKLHTHKKIPRYLPLWRWPTVTIQ